MVAIKWFAMGASLMIAQPLYAGDIERWRPQIDDASREFGVPAAWIERVMSVESAGATVLNGKPITSTAGAMGLMQLMPGTWAEMSARLRLDAGPYDPNANILAGTAYLRAMFDRFGYPGLFGAYNAGPSRYAKYLSGRQLLPRETLIYLNKTTGGAFAGSAAWRHRKVYPAPVFFSLGQATAFGSASGGGTLFAVRFRERSN